LSFSITINGREINKEQPPYIIAEVSANHNGSLLRAKKTMEAASSCGVDAIKIQTYTADTLTINCDSEDFQIKSGLWEGRSLYSLYEDAHTPYDWHKDLFDLAQRLGITLFSTAFDETAVDLLVHLKTPAFKVASFEMTDIPLIKYIAKQKKPMLISTGMASIDEISEAVEAARSSGCESILLFHCISSYPTPVEQSNLRNIQLLEKKFSLAIGLSDHTLGHSAAIAATALGASAIEKHFTLSRKDKGPDSDFSMEPEEMQTLVSAAKQSFYALGNSDFSRSKIEAESIVFRRSLYFVEDLEIGTVIKPEHIRRIRPGYGLAPKYFDDVIGKKTRKKITRGDRVLWDAIEVETKL